MDIERMYKFVVMEHVNDPKNKNEDLNSSNAILMLNDSCGDRLYLQVTIQNNVIEKISWNGSGCSLSMAVCSIMSSWLLKNTVTEVFEKLNEYEKLVLNQDYSKEIDFEELLVMENQLPARYKCATLFKQGMEVALKGKKNAN